jgi:glycosyltransferase involved in cell wall biosynthesis
MDWLRLVLETRPSTRLAIVGDGPARSDLERWFEGTPTVFTGYLAGNDLSGAYAAADIFVFPAANETFGNVVLEAMASSLPVVVARAGGPLDFVVHGETGLLFDPNSQQALVEAIGTLLDDPLLARRLARNARLDAEGRGWSAEMDLLLEDYAALIPTSRMRQAA